MVNDILINMLSIQMVMLFDDFGSGYEVNILVDAIHTETGRLLLCKIKARSQSNEQKKKPPNKFHSVDSSIDICFCCVLFSNAVECEVLFFCQNKN